MLLFKLFLVETLYYRMCGCEERIYFTSKTFFSIILFGEKKLLKGEKNG